MTPLLFQETSPGVFTVRGIGATRTSNGFGIQAFAFDPVAGSSGQVLSSYVYGFKFGTPDNSAQNIGLIDAHFDVNNEPPFWWTWRVSSGGPAVVQNGTIDNAANNFRAVGRDYSVQFTVTSVPEPATLVLTLVGGLALVTRRWRRV